MKSVGKPDAGNPHVRFDERGWETGRPSVSTRAHPRLYPRLALAKLPQGEAEASRGLKPTLQFFSLRLCLVYSFPATLAAGRAMLDLFYIVIGILFFAACWYLTKACEKL